MIREDVLDAVVFENMSRQTMKRVVALVDAPTVFNMAPEFALRPYPRRVAAIRAAFPARFKRRMAFYGLDR